MASWDLDLTCTSQGSWELQPTGSFTLLFQCLEVIQETDGLECPSSGIRAGERATEPRWESVSLPYPSIQEFQYFSYLPPGMKGPFKTWMKISKIKPWWGQAKYFTLIMFKECILMVTFLSSWLSSVQMEHGVLACSFQIRLFTSKMSKQQSLIIQRFLFFLYFFFRLRDLLKINVYHQSFSVLTDHFFFTSFLFFHGGWTQKKSLGQKFLTTSSNCYLSFEHLLPCKVFSLDKLG